MCLYLFNGPDLIVGIRRGSRSLFIFVPVRKRYIIRILIDNTTRRKNHAASLTTRKYAD